MAMYGQSIIGFCFNCLLSFDGCLVGAFECKKKEREEGGGGRGGSV